MSLNLGDARTSIQLDQAAAPAALNTEVVCRDVDTGETSFTPRSNNRIIDIKNTVDPAGGELFTLKTRRQERRRVVGRTNDFLTTFTGSMRPTFPIALAAGFFQFVNIQTATGAGLAVQSYDVTLQNPLSL